MSKNQQRAERAERALQTYIEARGDVYEANSSEIADLMADLLHLTMRLDQGDDAVESTLLLARMHFDVEHGNPDEEADEEQASDAEGRGKSNCGGEALAAVFGALRILIERADDLIAAIEGVTDQFESEVSALSDAASAAEKALRAAGSAS